MAEFLTANKLKVNDDKTHVLVMSTRQKRKYFDTSSIIVNTPTANITPSSGERLLGAQIHQDMKWRQHILEDENSLVKSLTMRIGALKKISAAASFKTRKMVANGIFMSKLIYLMPVWSGCEAYLVKALQVTQNKAARSVTHLGYRTPTKILLQQCGWLSVSQLMIYHSLVLLHKTLVHETPIYLYQKITSNGVYQHSSRRAEAGSLRQCLQSKSHLDLTKRGWCWRSLDQYNKLTAELRSE